MTDNNVTILIFRYKTFAIKVWEGTLGEVVHGTLLANAIFRIAQWLCSVFPLFPQSLYCLT